MDCFNTNERISSLPRAKHCCSCICIRNFNQSKVKPTKHSCCSIASQEGIIITEDCQGLLLILSCSQKIYNSLLRVVEVIRSNHTFIFRLYLSFFIANSQCSLSSSQFSWLLPQFWDVQTIVLKVLFFNLVVSIDVQTIPKNGLMKHLSTGVD